MRDAGDLPLAVDERLGGQRTQGGLIQPLEELAAAGAVQAKKHRNVLAFPRSVTAAEPGSDSTVRTSGARAGA
jgi:hypothetical protein